MKIDCTIISHYITQLFFFLNGWENLHNMSLGLKVFYCILMDFPFPFQPKDKGQVLYDSLFEYLNLDERDYFGLNYYDKSDNLVSTLHAVFVCL